MNGACEVMRYSGRAWGIIFFPRLYCPSPAAPKDVQPSVLILDAKEVWSRRENAVECLPSVSSLSLG